MNTLKTNSSAGTIWFTSDTHYHHRNIVKGESSWSNKDGCRDFKTTKEMNHTLICNFNEVIGQDDTLYHLGDVGWGEANIREFLTALNCKNVHWIPGNHDKEIKRSHSLQSLFKEVYNPKHRGYPIVNITIEGQEVILCHFAMRVWSRSHFGTYHLYGHSHGMLPDDPNSLSFDVGVDTNNFYPYSWEDVKRIMNKKNFTPINRDKGSRSYHES
jgi:calcineurin-like phosphoesterase family protein